MLMSHWSLLLMQFQTAFKFRYFGNFQYYIINTLKFCLHRLYAERILLINTLIIILMYHGCRKQWYHVVFSVGNAGFLYPDAWQWLFFNVDHSNFYDDFIMRNVSLSFNSGGIILHRLFDWVSWGPLHRKLTFPYLAADL